MRRPWARRTDREGRVVAPTTLDPASLDDLEVVELDATGAWITPSDAPTTQPMREPAYRPARDGTGLAGLWEALADR